MKSPRTLAVLGVGAALMLTPLSATAQTARVPDRTGDSVRAVDISGVTGRHDQQRLSAAIRIPRLRPGHLSGTELLIGMRGQRKVYVVGVLRDRRGRVVERRLSWRPANDPVEPRLLSCRGIRTSLASRQTTVSVPRSCLRFTGAQERVRMRVRTVDGTTGLQGDYYNDQSPWTPFLRRGSTGTTSSGPQGRVSAKSGVVVRALPTDRSALQGVLPHGKVFPVTCEVSGSVVRGAQAGAVSNRWYRLPGDQRAWVSSLYVDDVGQAPKYCGNGERSRGRVATALLIPREAPTTRANSHGGFERGKQVTINCQLRGERVDGNSLWYNLPLGLWVSARYVDHVGATPAFCTR